MSAGMSTRNLCVKIAGKEILHGLNVEIAAGRRTAIIGPNGAGKTTLLRALAGLNLGYHFDKNSFLSGAYAHNTGIDDSTWKKSYQVSYDYKGAQSEDKGSWGAYVAYRYLGGASPSATQDGALFGSKGVELGTNYTLFKNVILSAKYFKGKTIEKQADDKVQQLFGRVEFLF